MRAVSPDPTRAAPATAGQRGFTLIELMVVVGVVAVLAALAAPSFESAFLGHRLAGYANNFAASARLARSEAIKRNSVVRICRSSNGTSCSASGNFQQGWILFQDADNDGTVDADEAVIQVQQPLPANYRLTSDAYSVGFQGTGAGATSASLVLCRVTPTVGSQERAIAISATGRASVSTTKNRACP